jgi:hypothetical protein
MLVRLLKLIARGGAQRPASLAAELGVPMELLDQMLRDLERMGYLAGVVCPPAACAHCSASGPSCAPPAGGTVQLWRLTETGLRAAERRSA